MPAAAPAILSASMATSTIAAADVRARLRLPDSISVLAERDFRVIWTGSAISLVGTWMQVIAQGLVVLSLWNSALALGIVNVAQSLPTLAVMLFGGVLADRADKRLILLVTQTIMALLAFAVGVLVLTGAVQFWMFLVIAAGLGVAFGYDMPAYQALLPELVEPEKIGQVVALNSSTFHGSRMIGPAIAGAAIAAFGFSVAYFLNAASFLAVIVSLLIIRSRPRRDGPAAGTSAIDGLKEGLRHAAGRPNLRVMLLITALNTTFVFPSLAVLMPLYAKDVLHEGASVLGLLMAAAGVGSMIGALMLIWWADRLREARIWFGAVAAPSGLVLLAVTREPAIAIALSGLVSFAFSSQLGLITQMIQESTPSQFRGRVMSLFGITFNGTMPFAGLATAALAVAFGLPAVMVVAAVCYAALAAWLLVFAAGGIGAVVRASTAEYELVAAGGG
jgi:MFS family permease